MFETAKLSLHLMLMVNLCAAFRDTMIASKDPYLLAELDQTSSSKEWGKSLLKPIANSLEDNSHQSVVIIYLYALHQKATLLLRWCVPSNDKKWTSDINNLEDWIPCGYVHITDGSRKETYQFELRTVELFSLQVHFLVFELDLSTYSCMDSTFLVLCEGFEYVDKYHHCVRELELCGYRQPWIETMHSNKAMMQLQQVNIRYRFNLTYVYTSFERNVADVYIRHSKINPVFWRGNLQSLRHIESINVRIYKWTVVASLGLKLKFSWLTTNYFVGCIDIYDGDQDLYLLARQQSNGTEKTLDLGLSTTYFTSSVRYHADRMYVDPRLQDLFILDYDAVGLPVKHLRLGTMTRIHNHDKIFYEMYKIERTADDVGFPNISFVTRRFHGWNQDRCYFGGYVLAHYIKLGTSLLQYSQGPYCSKSFPSQPFIGSHGPRDVILGSFRYYLIIYAFGPLFNVDLDIYINSSDCEGIFEPVNICSAVVARGNHKMGETLEVIQYVAFINYDIICSGRRDRNTDIITYSVEIFNAKKCLILQSVSTIANLKEFYVFKGTFDLAVTVSKAGMYWNSSRISAFSTCRLIMGSLSLDTKDVELTGTSHNTYKTVGIVTLYIHNLNQHLGLYVALHISIVDYIQNCTNKTKEQFYDGIEGSITAKLHEFPNLCGVLHQLDRVQVVHAFKFKMHIHTDIHEKYFMYIVFKFKCLNNATGSAYNRLSIMADQGIICHTVDVLHSEMHINHYYMPLVFILGNQRICGFSMEYKVRQFFVTSLVLHVPRIQSSTVTVCIL